MARLSKTGVIYHEVIEAPGKVVIRLRLRLYRITMVQAMATSRAVLGDIILDNTVTIAALVEEDGKLKVLHCKDTAYSQQRNPFIAGTTKAATQMTSAP